MAICAELPRLSGEIEFWARNRDNESQEVSWIKELTKPVFEVDKICQGQSEEIQKIENQTFVEFFKASILYEIIGSYSTESMNRMNCMWRNLRQNPSKLEDKRRTVLDVHSLNKSSTEVEQLAPRNGQKKISSFHTTIR